MKRKLCGLLSALLIVSLLLSGCKITKPDDVAADAASSSSTAESSASATASSTASSEAVSSEQPSAVSSQPAGVQSSAKAPAGAQAVSPENQPPADAPKPVEPQDQQVNEKKELKCTLSITCKTILDNMDRFNQNKLSELPKDGVIYAQREVTFKEGESVFDVLARETQRNRIHMEFEATPMYNSNYIEGINNIYEFDCGDLSGWLYKVNGWFPGYGVSRYEVKEGDLIEFVYTCDKGRDFQR